MDAADQREAGCGEAAGKEVKMHDRPGHQYKSREGHVAYQARQTLALSEDDRI